MNELCPRGDVTEGDPPPHGHAGESPEIQSVNGNKGNTLDVHKRKGNKGGFFTSFH